MQLTLDSRTSQPIRSPIRANLLGQTSVRRRGGHDNTGGHKLRQVLDRAVYASDVGNTRRRHGVSEGIGTGLGH